MAEITVVKNGNEFKDPWSVKEGRKLLGKISGYLLNDGFVDVDRLEHRKDGGLDYTNVFYNPKTFVTVRVGWSESTDPSDWRDSVYGQAETEDVFSYVQVLVKAFDITKVNHYALELKELLV